jgi:hypothetical protein
MQDTLQHRFEHALFEGVSQNADERMKQLFHRRMPHLAVQLWIFDPTMLSIFQVRQAEVPLSLCGTPLHAATFCGLHEFTEVLTLEHSEHVGSPSFTGESGFR